MYKLNICKRSYKLRLVWDNHIENGNAILGNTTDPDSPATTLEEDTNTALPSSNLPEMVLHPDSIPNNIICFGKTPDEWNLEIIGEFATISVNRGNKKWKAIRMEKKGGIPNTLVACRWVITEEKPTLTIDLHLMRESCSVDNDVSYEWKALLVFSKGDAVKRYEGCGKVE